MVKAWDFTSTSFHSFINRHRIPVILQVLPALNSGGVEQGVIDINAAIVKAGGRSIVVSAGGLREREILRAGGLHITLPVNSKNPLTIAANIRRLRRVIKEHQVDIVHACSRAPAWSAERAVRGTAARYITSCHAAHKVGGALKRLYNSTIAKGERVITVSHFLADYLEKNYKVDPSIVRVIHRGIALEKFHPNSVTPDRLIRQSKKMRLPEGAPIVLLPARISATKGHMLLLDAIKQLQRDDIFCLFVGSDGGNANYRRELEGYISSLGLEGSVRIVTDCDDMPAVYMISTVVVSPSLRPEGLGRVPIEAQAMGRPVIAADHGGTKETILRDETGWLVAPGDVGALAAALDEIIAMEPKGRAKLATKAMSHVAEHFTNEQMCQGTLDVYAELLENTARRALPSNDKRNDRKKARVKA